MKVFINEKYSCFAKKSDGLRAVESDFFDNKCIEFIECFKFVPVGESFTDQYGLTHSDGIIWNYKPITPAIERIQATWEHERLAALMVERDALLNDIQTLVDEILEEE